MEFLQVDHESVRATVYCKSVEKLVVAHFVEKYPCFNGRARQHSAQTQAVGTPLITRPRLLVQHIRTCPPYLETVSFIPRPRKRRPWWQVTRSDFHFSFRSSCDNRIYIIRLDVTVRSKTNYLIFCLPPSLSLTKRLVSLRCQSVPEQRNIFKAPACLCNEMF